MLPESFLACLALLEGCFTSPSYQRFITLMTGWVLCIGKHTVTGVMRAAGVAGAREHSGYHRFFSRGAWEPRRVGLALMEAVLKLLPSGERVVLSLDDTLARQTGKHISSAGMHRDPLLSCAARPFWQSLKVEQLTRARAGARRAQRQRSGSPPEATSES